MNDDDAQDIDTELDALVQALLADPEIWAEPDQALGERVADAIGSEALLAGPAPLPVAGHRGGWLRPALFGAVAAVLFMFVGVVLFSALGGGLEETDAVAVELVPTGLVPDVSGEISIESFESGLRLGLSASGLPRRDDGRFYQGWLRTTDGDLVTVGTFHDGIGVTLWAGVELDRVEAFSITLEAVVAGDDAAQEPSGQVVLRADIAP